ncbi:IS66 family transposase [Jeongeupia naejangsanensis]|uniref:IS66 family transposase n=1 Tax=Jeongeupia naejangsanensis TaxID=613195 RepID=UPI003570A32B
MGRWAHARRKLHDLHASPPTVFPAEVLRHIGELYAVEAQARGRPLAERLVLRRQMQPTAAGRSRMLAEGKLGAHLAQKRCSDRDQLHAEPVGCADALR